MSEVVFSRWDSYVCLFVLYYCKGRVLLYAQSLPSFCSLREFNLRTRISRTNWTAAWENVPSVRVRPTKTQIGLRTRTVSSEPWRNFASLAIQNEASEESAQSDQSLRCPQEETLYPWLSKMCAQWRFWWDWVNAKADLNLLRKFRFLTRPSRKHAYIILTPLNPTFI